MNEGELKHGKLIEIARDFEGSERESRGQTRKLCFEASFLIKSQTCRCHIMQALATRTWDCLKLKMCAESLFNHFSKNFILPTEVVKCDTAEQYEFLRKLNEY